MPNADLPPAPAADAVAFRLRPARLWLSTVLPVALSILAFRAVYILLRGTTGASLDSSDYLDAALAPVIAAVTGATVIAIRARRRPGFVRSSAAGLEFAASGRVPVFLPWPQVRSVAFRRRGAFTELVITPLDVAAVGCANGPGRAPRTRWRKGQTAFFVEVGVMAPGPSAMAAELNRRMHP